MPASGPALVRVGSDELAVVTHPGTDPPLLFVNGLGQTLATWDRLMTLMPDRSTILFDQPGAGSSPDSCTAASIPAMAKLCDRLIEQLGHDRVDVLGYSWGGLVAQHLAATQPERVRRLCLVATSFGAGSVPGTPLSLGVAVLRHVIDSTTQTFDRLSRHVDLPEHPPAEAATMAGLAAQLTAAGTWSTFPLSRHLTQPTLVVAGADDQVVPVVNAHLLAELIPDARLAIVPHAGHDLVRSQPALLASLLEEFLAAG